MNERMVAPALLALTSVLILSGCGGGGGGAAPPPQRVAPEGVPSETATLPGGLDVTVAAASGVVSSDPDRTQDPNTTLITVDATGLGTSDPPIAYAQEAVTSGGVQREVLLVFSLFDASGQPVVGEQNVAYFGTPTAAVGFNTYGVTGLGPGDHLGAVIGLGSDNFPASGVYTIQFGLYTSTRPQTPLSGIGSLQVLVTK